MLLTVDQMTRRFGRKTVLHGLRFCLRRGEVLGLLGPNGAGKTTALRMLAGTLSPSSGRVLLNGIDLHRAPRHAKARLGYLPERAPIYPEMRVDDYLAFAGRLRRIAAGDLPDAVARVKARCGLTHVGQRLLGRLSKGYQQRAGIAQALIHQPDLVILDEPADGLDPVQIRELRGLIRGVAEEAGVIVSSHALTEVQASCSRAIILHQGRQLHEADLKAQPRVGTRSPGPAQAATGAKLGARLSAGRNGRALRQERAAYPLAPGCQRRLAGPSPDGTWLWPARAATLPYRS